MSFKGETIFSDSHDKRQIWNLSITMFCTSSLITSVLIWFVSGGTDFWPSLPMIIGVLFLFSFLSCLWFLKVEAKWIYYNITSIGIELGGSPRSFMSQTFIPFRDVLWFGPDPKRVDLTYGKHKFQRWTVKWQRLSSFPYVSTKSWILVYTQGVETYALKFYPPRSFTDHLTAYFEQHGLSNLIE